MLLPKLAFFAMWDGTGNDDLVPCKAAGSPAAALPCGSYAPRSPNAAEGGNAAASPAGSLPVPATEPSHIKKLTCGLNPTHGSRLPAAPPLPPSTPDDQGADRDELDAPIHVHSDGSEPDDTALGASVETVGSSNCGPQEPAAAPVMVAPNLAAVLATPDSRKS